MKITFHGAAQEVTGSCTLIETDTLRFLVDCGMFQGGREQDARNRAAFPFEADKIDFVLLTHAHIDHSGLLPKLWQDGFRGPIYTTQATANLLNIMLRDSAHIQESEMERARRHAKGRPQLRDACEPEAVAALAGRMQTDLGWRVDLPEPGESFLEETISEKVG
tara:strand:- start:7120 stop:7611 length:492 start_codon:yes stop_codon:yes gene_type:complete